MSCVVEIREEGFEGFVITHSEEDKSILMRTGADQVTLYGVLAKLRDLGLPLVSVKHSGVWVKEE
jgi:hypothetical protein